jgi:polyhydroxybutyrate depolymerase
MQTRWLLSLFLVCGVGFLVGADQPPQGSGRAESSPGNLKRMTWQVDGQTREALVYIPAAPGEHPPLVFAFHGHGGRAELAARQFAFHTFWPEAICVYPQGLLTATQIDPTGKLPGWQKAVGDEGDRDLKFYDAMLAQMKADYHIDEKRVFCAGHSNGGFFTYVLWAARGDTLAAVAPISAFLNPKDATTLTPKPVLHVAGEKDPLVKFDLQQKMIDLDRKIDGCDPDGKPAGEFCTKYTSKDGPPVVTFIHPGGHAIPDGAPRRIVEFFKNIAMK